jgi:hypothetical protein
MVVTDGGPPGEASFPSHWMTCPRSHHQAPWANEAETGRTPPHDNQQSGIDPFVNHHLLGRPEPASRSHHRSFWLHARRFVYRPGERRVANPHPRNSLQELPPVRKGDGRHSNGGDVMVDDDGLGFSL